MIEKYSLGNNLKICRVLNGMWQIADMERNARKVDQERAIDAMNQYVEAGFTSFDMADHYGSAEKLAGTFQSRLNSAKSVQLLTKWVPSARITNKEQVQSAIKRSLDRLQTDSIDLLQYHAWNYNDPEWLDSLYWLQELKEQGLIANLGVTNFDAAHLNMALASGIDIVSNQISYSLIDGRARGAMASICEKYNVKLLAYGTLVGGFLDAKWKDRPEPKTSDLHTWSQMKYKRFIDEAGGWHAFQLFLSDLDKIAQEKSATIAQLSCRYMLGQPHVAGIILGTRFGMSNHISENLKIFDLHMTPQDVQSIQSAMTHLTGITRNCGDEYRSPPFLTAAGDLSDHLGHLPSVYTPVKYNNREIINSGTPWEARAGYARAIRKGNRIFVSGTTATHRDRLIGGSDASAQTHFIIDKIQASIESLGGTLEDVDRTRIFVANKEDCEAIALAHGKRFAHIKPANTLVQAGLIGNGYKVEIEAEATIS